MERDDNIAELISQNPVNKGLDYSYVNALIREVTFRHFPEFKEIDGIQHVRHKRRVGKRNSTFIYSYYVHGRDAQDNGVTRHLIYSSHSDGSRLKAYKALSMLVVNGFNNDNTYTVIVPLEYVADIQTMIYEAVGGKTLYQHMHDTADPSLLHPILKCAAAWINKFHHFALPEKVLTSIPLFDSSNMNWTKDELMSAVTEVNKEQAHKLQAFFDAFFAEEKKLSGGVPPLLVYGDLHPENIITRDLNPATMTMIDFTDVARGDQMRDIGSFIQQLHFMGIQFYDRERVNTLRQVFLEYYFDCAFEKIPIDLIQRVNLYQAWNSLRGFVYFFFQENERWRSYGLLEDAWRYLTLAQNAERKLIITY